MVASVDLSGFAPSEISNSMTEENINRILKAREIKISNKEENIKNILWASVGLHPQKSATARYCKILGASEIKIEKYKRNYNIKLSLRCSAKYYSNEKEKWCDSIRLEIGNMGDGIKCEIYRFNSYKEKERWSDGNWVEIGSDSASKGEIKLPNWQRPVKLYKMGSKVNGLEED